MISGRYPPHNSPKDPLRIDAGFGFREAHFIPPGPGKPNIGSLINPNKENQKCTKIQPSIAPLPIWKGPGT